MSKMWSGRFSEAGSDLLDEFNASIMFDRNLYAQDIRGSIAHSKMLAKVGILTHEEQKKVEMGLLTVKNEIENDEFDFILADEDIHMAVEKRLTELVGDVGKKSTHRKKPK